MKILALHGFAQTGAYMDIKTKQLQKQLKDFEFIFPNATYILDSQGDNIIMKTQDSQVVQTFANPKCIKAQGNRLGWMMYEEDLSYRCGINMYGLEQSIKYILGLIEQHKPDRIIGFSQGASMILYILMKNLLPYKIPCMLVSPYFYDRYDQSQKEHPFDAIWMGSDNNVFSCIYGTGDELMPQKSYENLKMKYPSCNYFTHEGGHYMCCSGAMKDVWNQWARGE